MNSMRLKTCSKILVEVLLIAILPITFSCDWAIIDTMQLDIGVFIYTRRCLTLQKVKISSFMIHRGGIYCIEEDDSLRRDVAPKQQIHGHFFFFMHHYVCTECSFFSCATIVGWVNSSYSYKSLPSKWHYLPINLWGITEQWVSQPEDALQLHMFDYSWWQEDYSRYSASRWWRMSDIQ